LTVAKKTQIRALMYYLRRYLAGDPARRARLFVAFRKFAGVPLQRNSLWRQTMLRVEPPGSTLLAYLGFLLREKAITPDKTGKSLFVYAHPELLRAGK